MSNENQHVDNALDRLTELSHIIQREILKKKEPEAFDDFESTKTRPIVENALYRRDNYHTQDATNDTQATTLEKKSHRNDDTIISILKLYLPNPNVVEYEKRKEST